MCDNTVTIGPPRQLVRYHLQKDITVAKEDTHAIRVVPDRVVAILKEDMVHHFPRFLRRVGLDLPSTSTTVGGVCLVYELLVEDADGLR